MAGLSTMSGCVVTDKVDFHEPINNPPAFIVDQSSGLQPGQIVFLPNSGETPSWTFNLRVRDIDVEQNLDAHWRIIKPRMAAEERGEVLMPANGVDEIRSLGIKINSSQLLTDNCHRVEIAVSGSFLMPFEGEPVPDFLSRSDRFDLALFAFWVWEGDGTDIDAAKLVETCNAQLFEPAVTTTSGASGEPGGVE